MVQKLWEVAQATRLVKMTSPGCSAGGSSHLAWRLSGGGHWPGQRSLRCSDVTEQQGAGRSTGLSAAPVPACVVPTQLSETEELSERRGAILSGVCVGGSHYGLSPMPTRSSVLCLVAPLWVWSSLVDSYRSPPDHPV